MSAPEDVLRAVSAPSVREDRRSAALRAFLLFEPRTRAEVRAWADTRGMSRSRLERALVHLGVQCA